MGTYSGKPSKIVKGMTEDEILSELPRRWTTNKNNPNQELADALLETPGSSEYANLNRKRTNGDMTSSSSSTEEKKGFNWGSTYKPQ